MSRFGAVLLALSTAVLASPGVARAGTGDPPLRLAVLVDTSQAARPYVADLRDALKSFLRDMQGREIALWEFGERSSLVTAYTSDPVRLQAGVNRLFARTGSGSYVLDAIIEAARSVRETEGARTAIVVITAEGPEFSQRYHETVLDELKKTGATLHAFVLDQHRRRSVFDDAARERDLTLEKATRLTGGRRDHLLTSMALEGRLRELAADLKTQ